jgi:hypothetical protein
LEVSLPAEVAGAVDVPVVAVHQQALQDFPETGLSLTHPAPTHVAVVVVAVLAVVLVAQ